MVFLSGILGVPWQDLASKESLADSAPLEYLSHKQLTAQQRWPLVLGSEDGTPPGDKLMFETFVDRTTLFGSAAHPLVGDSAALASSATMNRPNAINGHETNIADASELQYACIFPLPFIKDCAVDTSVSCDCKPASANMNRALCNGTSQTHAKAFPSVRELRVLKAFGDLTGNAIPSSICPKTLTDTADPSYGYTPVVSAIVNGLRPVLVQ
jgi:hypothetical protein